MVVRLSPETEARLLELASATGRAPDDLVEDAMSAYLAEIAQARTTLDSRFDEIKSGRVQPVDGHVALSQLRDRSKARRGT
jgi:predicted transcriptional regulator